MFMYKPGTLLEYMEKNKYRLILRSFKNENEIEMYEVYYLDIGQYVIESRDYMENTKRYKVIILSE